MKTNSVKADSRVKYPFPAFMLTSLHLMFFFCYCDKIPAKAMSRKVYSNQTSGSTAISAETAGQAGSRQLRKLVTSCPPVRRKQRVPVFPILMGWALLPRDGPARSKQVFPLQLKYSTSPSCPLAHCPGDSKSYQVDN